MTHGELDTEIPFKWGHDTYKALHDHGVRGGFYHEQLGLHDISYKQLQAVNKFILQTIPDPKYIFNISTIIFNSYRLFLTHFSNVSFSALTRKPLQKIIRNLQFPVWKRRIFGEISYIEIK